MCVVEMYLYGGIATLALLVAIILWDLLFPKSPIYLRELECDYGDESV